MNFHNEECMGIVEKGQQMIANFLRVLVLLVNPVPEVSFPSYVRAM